MAIDRDKIIYAAGKYVEKNKYDKAILEYQKLIGLDPRDARTLLKMGDLQSRLKRYADAIASYNKVANIYADGGFSLKAIAVFKQVKELLNTKAPELKENYVHIMPRLADIYAQLNLTSDALAAYDEAATTLQKAGRDLDAIKLFQKTVHLDPQNPLPYLRLAEASCRVKNVDEAIEAFWQAAELLLSLERSDDALKVIERILHFREEPRYARIAGQLYLKRNDHASGLLALAKLQLAFTADPKDLETLGLLAQAFELIEQPKKALAVHFEMARIAHEQKNAELFQQIMSHLQQTAGNREELQALQQLPPLANAPASPSSNQPSQAEEIVSLDDEVEYAEEVEYPEEVEYLEEPVDLNSELDEPENTALVTPSSSVKNSAPAGVVEGQRRDSFQPQAPAHGAIQQAEVFRAQGDISQGVLTLHAALELDANSIPIRQKLRELLVDAGDRAGAIAETLNIAIIHIHNQNPDGAEILAQEILEIEPDDADALNILAHVSALRDNQNIVSSEEHLNSYDLEGIHPSHLINEIPEPPIASRAIAEEVEAELIDDDEQANAAAHRTHLDQALNFKSSGEGSAQTTATPAVDRPSLEAIEEALEEAEFFTSQGLFEDAITLLQEMLSGAPDHLLLQERLREAETEAARANEVQNSAATAEIEEDDLEDQVLDIAASLDALDQLAQPEASDVLNEDAEVDVDLVFAKFKEGVKKTVHDNDAATHYDLGLAYKEMGLLSDAQGEFELASQDEEKAFMCFAMVGIISADLKDDAAAVSAFQKALHTKESSTPQLVSLRYDLALAYERLADSKSAIEQYQTILQMDNGYRDVQARLSALGGEDPRTAEDEQDDLDAAFDNLLS